MCVPDSLEDLSDLLVKLTTEANWKILSIFSNPIKWTKFLLAFEIEDKGIL